LVEIEVLLEGVCVGDNGRFKSHFDGMWVGGLIGVRVGECGRVYVLPGPKKRGESPADDQKSARQRAKSAGCEDVRAGVGVCGVGERERESGDWQMGNIYRAEIWERERERREGERGGAINTKEVEGRRGGI